MQRQEIPNNTDEQVADYLARTLEVIEGSDIPGDLRPEAFSQVFMAIAGKQILMVQAQPVSLAGLPDPFRRQ